MNDFTAIRIHVHTRSWHMHGEYQWVFKREVGVEKKATCLRRFIYMLAEDERKQEGDQNFHPVKGNRRFTHRYSLNMDNEGMGELCCKTLSACYSATKNAGRRAATQHIQHSGSTHFTAHTHASTPRQGMQRTYNCESVIPPKNTSLNCGHRWPTHPPHPGIWKSQQWCRWEGQTTREVWEVEWDDLSCSSRGIKCPGKETERREVITSHNYLSDI